MIKHILMANFKPEISQPERDEFGKKSVETLSQIPGARNVMAGRALEIDGQTRYEAALFVDFDDEAALKIYAEHPAHKAAVAQTAAMFSEFIVSNYLC